MFPLLRHRLVIFAAILTGALSWLAVGPMLEAADRSPGLSLWTARVGLPTAVGLVVAAGLPALVLGVVTSMMGNLLSGVFVVGAALSVLAWWGGPIDGWMRQAALPHDYRGLMIEVLIWQAGAVAMLAVIQWMRSPMRSRWPALAFEDHLGVDTAIRFPALTSLASGLASAVVSGTLAFLLIRDSDPGQVLVSLLIAFTLGGMAAQMIFPHNNPVGILLSPTLVALAGYGFVLLMFHNKVQVLTAWHNHALDLGKQVPGLARLPIHYASAGLAGAAMGVGLAQVFTSGNPERSQAIP